MIVAHVDRHLVNVDALLDTELRDQDVEGGIKYTNDLGLTDDGPVALRQVGDKDTEVQVGRLLLRQLSRVALAVISVNVNPMRSDDETYMLHCCATFATASRSMLNLGSAAEFAMSMRYYAEDSRTHVRLGEWHPADDVR